MSVGHQAEPKARSLDKRVCPRVKLGPGCYAVFPTGGAPPIRDLSLGGAFVEDRYPMAVGARLNFGLHLGNRRLHITAVVRRSVPGQGMGVQFLEISAEDRVLLEKFIAAQARTPQPAPTAREAAPPSRLARSGEAAPACPATSGATGLSPQLEMFTADLHRVEESLKGQEGQEVDPRVLSGFREAVDHIRQTAWAVQEWLSLQKQQGDVYSVLPLLITERMRRATKIANDITMDVDGAEINDQTEGLEELHRAIARLHERLSRFFTNPL